MKAEGIINSKLDNFAVNLRDYQFVRFYASKIEIVFNLWALILKFDNNGNLLYREVRDLAVTIDSGD